MKIIRHDSAEYFRGVHDGYDAGVDDGFDAAYKALGQKREVKVENLTAEDLTGTIAREAAKIALTCVYNKLLRREKALSAMQASDRNDGTLNECRAIIQLIKEETAQYETKNRESEEG